MKKSSTVWVAGGLLGLVLVAVLTDMGNWFGRAKVGTKEKPVSKTALEERMDTLERSFRSMRLEWEDVYDKLMKAAARLNARTRREAPAPSDEEVAPEKIAPPGPTLGTHSVLEEARTRRRG